MIELIFFSGNNCGVCHAMKPKLLEMITKEFGNEVKYSEVDVEQEVAFSAQHMVFTLPVLVIKRNDIEVKRFVRAFGIREVEDYLKRIISPTA